MQKLLLALTWIVVLGAGENPDTLREFGPLLNAGAVAVITGLFVWEHIKRGPAREQSFRETIHGLADAHQKTIEELGKQHKEAIEKLGREYRDAIEKLESEHKEVAQVLLNGFRDERRTDREDRAIDHAERREERRAMVEVMTQVKEAVAMSMNHVESVSVQQKMNKRT